jgi:hypothetical protein
MIEMRLHDTEGTPAAEIDESRASKPGEIGMSDYTLVRVDEEDNVWVLSTEAYPANLVDELIKSIVIEPPTSAEGNKRINRAITALKQHRESSRRQQWRLLLRRL